MYSLTLTASERQAFDWVANRYNSGKIKELLLHQDVVTAYHVLDAHLLTLEQLEETVSWSGTIELEFQIPEHIAWQIRDLAEEERYSFPCFAPELKEKLIKFCDSIV